MFYFNTLVKFMSLFPENYISWNLTQNFYNNEFRIIFNEGFINRIFDVM